MHTVRLEDWKTHARIVQETSELPDWFDNTTIYLDVETTSGEDKVASLNPWHNCKALGVCVVVDKEEPLYIPLRHRGPNTLKNVPVEPVLRWLQKVIDGSRQWVNQNLKYDMHVLAHEGIDVTRIKVVDTLTLCRLAPQVEEFRYVLKEVMQKWFFKDIYRYEEDMKLYLPRGIKDYGLIPIDKMGVYGCVDVLSVRYIHYAISDSMPDECNTVFETENAVTRVLYDIETTGMRLDLPLLHKHYECYPAILLAMTREIDRLVTFPDFRPHTNGDCYSLIVQQLGLPVLEYTDKGKPSFGADTILAYRAMRPDLDPLWTWILKYKEYHKLYSAFIASFEEKRVGNELHSDYNQIVRTGRMSCRTPNAQQMSPAAKQYIIPSSKDNVILDIDFSQIEFRLIAHYTKAEKIIKEYKDNPDADYHKIVANLCSIERYPAKRVNFMLGFGGGRGKCIEILSSVPSIIGELKERGAIEKRANEVYARYHKMLPTLRPTTYQASTVMRRRGYVRTIMGRRRHLPRKAHFKAFNSIIQGSAADLFKAALVRLHAYVAAKPNVNIIGCVHDSIVLDIPKDLVEKETPILKSIMEELPEGVQLRVPLRADSKYSDKNWRECE